MSADRLREAARTVREAAAGATPGPWVLYPTPRLDGDSPVAWTITRPYDNHDGPCPETCGAEPLRTGAEDCDECFVREGDAAWIALMDPTVGRALADWLDATARAVVGTSQGDVPFEAAALAVADAVLGTTNGAGE